MDRVQKIAPTAARIVLGLLFAMFGLNGFLQFMPMPPMSERGSEFLAALAATGYMVPLLNGTQVVAGLLLLSGFRVALALVMLAPVIANIVAFHLFLDPAGLPIAIVVLVLSAYVGHYQRSVLKPLFTGIEAERARASRPSVLSAA